MVQYGKGPYGEARMAVCKEHGTDALEAMDGGIAEIRRVRDDDHYRCHCGKLADFYLLVIEETP